MFDEINNNTLYVFCIGNWKQKYKIASDQFFYHTHSLIQTMFEFYDNMFTLKEYCTTNNIGNDGCLIESMLYLYIIQNNINLKCSNIQGKFVREFEFKVAPDASVALVAPDASVASVAPDASDVAYPPLPTT